MADEAIMSKATCYESKTYCTAWVTTKRDAGELCDSLDRYLRGQKWALSVIAVPTEEKVAWVVKNPRYSD
jgi:hypothetical protein